MGFLDDLLGFGQSFATRQPQNGALNDPGFFGSGPGFDIWDIPDVLGRLLRTTDPLQNGFPPLDPQTSMTKLPEIGAGGPAEGGMTMERPAGVTGQRTAMYIGGNCPGLWHTTELKPLFDKNSGVFLRNVGGNRVANRVSLVQDDSGALEFFGPLKATFTLKHKPRRRYHTHSYRHKGRAHKRVAAKTGHRHKYTRKQLAAGFGGKEHRKAHA